MRVTLVRQLVAAVALLAAALVSGAFAQSPVSAQEAPFGLAEQCAVVSKSRGVRTGRR